MRCIRSILGVSRSRMWDEHITNEELLVRWGDSETIKDKIAHRRLEWLGHVARMPDNRIPKQVLFGSFLPRRPAHGPRRRWKDCAVRDLRARGVEASWYDVACESRAEWRSTYQEPDNVPEPPPRVVCTVCGRDFARKGDMARHRCLEERARPVSEQRGASQCGRCGRWLRSRGGLVRHVCASTVDAAVPPGTTGASAPAEGCCAAHCDRCGRCFRGVRGRGRHRCSRVAHRPTAAERSAFQHVCICGKRMRLPVHLERHRASCPLSLSSQVSQ